MESREVQVEVGKASEVSLKLDQIPIEPQQVEKKICRYCKAEVPEKGQGLKHQRFKDEG